ncbi:MAG: dicarboxylate/amino acid:cation symporter [Vicinamibacteria bacterium]
MIASRASRAAPPRRLATGLVVGFSLGLVAGLALGPSVEPLRPLADLFIGLLRAIALPVVAASMLTAAASLAPARLGRLGAVAVAAYLGASAIATLTGVAVATALPAAHADLVPAAPPAVPGWTALVARWLPTSGAWSVDLLILPVLVVSAAAGLVLGAAATRAGTGPHRVVGHLSTGVSWLLLPLWWYAPVGVFALTAIAFARPGVIAGPLVAAFVSVYLSQAVVAAGLAAALWLGGVPPWRFVAAVRDVLVTALATGSSAATLPIELKAASERAGIAASTAAVTVPLGVSISKVGTAAYVGALAVWAAQVTATPLEGDAFARLVAVAVSAAMVTPPIAGGGLIMLGLVFQQAGLPLGLVGVLGGLPLLGKGNTPLNALGRLVTARLLDGRRGAALAPRVTLTP